MIVIGLGHKARQGKNYVANYMVEANPSIKLYAFADELKLYCRENHDTLLAQWQLAQQTKKMPAQKDDPIYGYTPILQWYGTEIARKADPNVWVKKLASRIETEKPDMAIITDVRFPNEADFVKSYEKGFLVDVIRRKADGSQYLDPSRLSTHPSEVALDDYEGWDFIITERDGNLQGLRAKSIGVLNIVLNWETLQQFVAEHEEQDRTEGAEIANRIDNAVHDATGFPYVDTIISLEEYDGPNSGGA
jgi:hypothetical protein